MNFINRKYPLQLLSLLLLFLFVKHEAHSQITANPDHILIGRENLPKNGEVVSGKFFFFDATKGALRGGQLFVSRNWSPDSLGFNSIAFGFNTKASGDWATAFGKNTTASGSWATAFGVNTKASGYSGTALGEHTEASGVRGATALGYATKASGDRGATALGYYTNARGDNCTVVGRYNGPLVMEGQYIGSGSPLFVVGNGDDGAHSNAMVVRKDGHIGIGENVPLSRIHIQDFDIGLKDAHLENDGLIIESGDATIGLYSDNGGNWGSAIQLGELNLGALVDKWSIARRTTGGASTLHFTFGTDDNYGNNNTLLLIDVGGNVFADGTFTGGGADLAEAFEIEGRKSDYEIGDVLVISTRSDRKIQLSQTPYSFLVAGVYATKPGVLLSPDGISETMEGKVPMGMVGVIPTKVTLEGGVIQRGDLLVTSSTSGHAMKADKKELGRRMMEGEVGMVLGKALARYDGSGSGLIEVLVNVK